MSKTTWDICEGRLLAEHLEHKFSALPDSERCHVALGGSVLHKGQSAKDVDIIILPRKKPKDRAWDWQAAARFIEQDLGVKLTLCVWNSEKSTQCDDEKLVRVATLKNGQRVDFFFLS
jgi:hypothetical protein